MNKDTLQGQWKQMQGEVQRRWSKLTDNDLNQIRGDAEKLLGKIQEHYGYARERAQQEVDTFLKSHKSTS